MSAPISERDAVLRERRAHASARCSAFAASLDNKKHYLYERANPCVECRDAAAHRYPLPKVERPRVVQDPHRVSVGWSVLDGDLVASVPFAGAHRAVIWSIGSDNGSYKPTPERVAVWADLLANPLEEVEAES